MRRKFEKREKHKKITDYNLFVPGPKLGEIKIIIIIIGSVAQWLFIKDEERRIASCKFVKTGNFVKMILNTSITACHRTFELLIYNHE